MVLSFLSRRQKAGIRLQGWYIDHLGCGQGTLLFTNRHVIPNNRSRMINMHTLNLSLRVLRLNSRWLTGELSTDTDLVCRMWRGVPTVFTSLSVDPMIARTSGSGTQRLVWSVAILCSHPPYVDYFSAQPVWLWAVTRQWQLFGVCCRRAIWRWRSVTQRRTVWQVRRGMPTASALSLAVRKASFINA